MPPEGQKGDKGDKPFYEGMGMAQTPDISELLTGSMDLADYKDKWAYNEDYDCYSLEYVVYCENPVDPVKECMNIYVPAAYMNADGTINETGEINGYTAQSAPIIYKNGVGGYAEADASKISDKTKEYLEQGYVFVSPASRGKETQSEDGSYIGKSPTGLVDLKAGVRFLKANDKVMAGDANKIISIGTSAGGAMSALLGTTGNSEDYKVYLEEIGAVMDSTDDVYAAQVYCPITDLDHADLAYEWMYADILENLKTQFPDEYETYMEAYGSVSGDKKVEESRKLLNPMNYIGTDKQADTADHIRIRVGTEDGNTSLSVAAVLALALEDKTDSDVDYALVWAQPHGDADYEGELISWINSICK